MIILTKKLMITTSCQKYSPRLYSMWILKSWRVHSSSLSPLSSTTLSYLEKLRGSAECSRSRLRETRFDTGCSTSARNILSDYPHHLHPSRPSYPFAKLSQVLIVSSRKGNDVTVASEYTTCLRLHQLCSLRCDTIHKNWPHNVPPISLSFARDLTLCMTSTDLSDHSHLYPHVIPMSLHSIIINKLVIRYN